jgi:saccharopine dehydrogenase-like NADP-dependent oxidoreductase
MLASGELPHSGFIRQEDIPLDRFLANRFGRYYAETQSNNAAA